MVFPEYDQDKIRPVRRYLELTCEELGDICHLSRQSVNAIENGKSYQKSIVTLLGLALDRVAYERGPDAMAVVEAIRSC